MEYFKINFHIPPLPPQSVIILEADNKVFFRLSHLLLFFNYHVYVSRSPKDLYFEALLISSIKVRKLEKILGQSDERKRKLFTEKWKAIPQNLLKNFSYNNNKFSYIADTIGAVRTQSHM